MKVSDYIVDFFIKRGVTDVFGYPGGMLTHLMESFSHRTSQIQAHVNYHEQASAFCACGYAQVLGSPGVAYATSGPGATNLITGIANAYFDSIPTVFLTGQVNTFEAKGALGIRQNGFQETDIVSIVKEITKYSTYVSDARDIRYELEKAWHIANEGRKGPVLLDIPMNVQREEVASEDLKSFIADKLFDEKHKYDSSLIGKLLQNSKKPVLLIGAGIKTAAAEDLVQKLVSKWNIPVVSSMLAFDVFPRNHVNYFGFIGAYGDRAANFIIAKSDLIISLGSRLDVRQIGGKREYFGNKAQLIRVDIDAEELSRKVKDDEIQINYDLKRFLEEIIEKEIMVAPSNEWNSVCNEIKNQLSGLDIREPNKRVKELSCKLPSDIVITTDVGQNQVWIAQSFLVKKGQKVFFSGGLGAMGYSLPAAIGAYYACRKPVVCFCGDGGIQMNIQELQFVAREHLPITIVILNNAALGMIRHFQEMYFQANYYQTVGEGGYTVPDFERIAYAYDLTYHRVCSQKDIDKYDLEIENPNILEIVIEGSTYVFPKLEFGKLNQDQEPLLDRKVFDYLMALGEKDD